MSRTSRPAGFTLIELMMVVALLAVLMMIAAPSIRDITLTARMTGQTNDLITDLSVARAEAVKRGGRTAMCATATTAACAAVPPTNACQCQNTTWNQGWIIFSDTAPANGGTFGQVDLGLAPPLIPDVILKVVPAINGANEPQPNTIISANTPNAVIGPWIGFRPSGVVNPGGTGASITFDLCDSRNTGNVAANMAANKGRKITVTGTGRASVRNCTCGPAGTCP